MIFNRLQPDPRTVRVEVLPKLMSEWAKEDPAYFDMCLEEFVGREVLCAMMDSSVREKWATYFKNSDNKEA